MNYSRRMLGGLRIEIDIVLLLKVSAGRFPGKYRPLLLLKVYDDVRWAVGAVEVGG